MDGMLAKLVHAAAQVAYRANWLKRYQGPTEYCPATHWSTTACPCDTCLENHQPELCAYLEWYHDNHPGWNERHLSLSIRQVLVSEPRTEPREEAEYE